MSRYQTEAKQVEAEAMPTIDFRLHASGFNGAPIFGLTLSKLCPDSVQHRYNFPLFTHTHAPFWVERICPWLSRRNEDHLRLENFSRREAFGNPATKTLD